MKKTILYISPLIAVVSCQSGKSGYYSSSDTSFSIDQNLSQFKPTAENFSINTEKANSIKTADGGYLFIPAGAFTDKNGKPVQANLQYTPIHGVADIISSGIPMQAYYKGKTGQFVSDGMFQLSANANGKNLELSNGKEIEVFIPSKDIKNTYQYWYFNEKTGNWEETAKRDSLCDNSDLQATANKMNILFSGEARQKKAEPPVAYNPGKMVLDLEFNENTYPELIDYSRIMWQYSGTDPNQDPANNSWIFDKEWSNTNLTKISDMNYQLIVLTGEKTFTTIVTPALAGKDLVKARQKFAKLAENADNSRSNYQNAEAINKEDTKLYNRFSVAKMGIFNCDRFYGDPAASDFDFTATLDNKAVNKNQTIYIIMDNKTNVIQYPANGRMHVNPKAINGIITVAGKGMVAAATAGCVKELKQSKGGKIKLAFSKLNIQGSSLQSILDKL